MGTLISTGGLMLSIATTAVPPAAAQKTAKPANAVTVQGCLTKGTTNQFVLTPTTAGDPLSSSVEAKTHAVVPTYTYQLMGGQNLDAYVGKIVSAKGTVTGGDQAAAKVDETQERQASRSAATPQGKTPEVKTESKAKIEVRQLAVQSVTSTGQSCSTSGRTF
jgi:hypothetical protein